MLFRSGGNQVNLWRTLTIEEWRFVFNTRSTSSGIRYAKARVNNIDGVILLPDNWNSSYYNLNYTNTSSASFNSNVINSSTWLNSLQAHGAVFLPAAGYRVGTNWVNNSSYGVYWTASYANSDVARSIFFKDAQVFLDNFSITRWHGFSVRLVCPAE